MSDLQSVGYQKTRRVLLGSTEERFHLGRVIIEPYPPFMIFLVGKPARFAILNVSHLLADKEGIWLDLSRVKAATRASLLTTSARRGAGVRHPSIEGISWYQRVLLNGEQLKVEVRQGRRLYRTVNLAARIQLVNHRGEDFFSLLPRTAPGAVPR